MCPQGTELVLITDQANIARARNYLHQHATALEANFLCIEDLSPGTQRRGLQQFQSHDEKRRFLEQTTHESF